MCAPAPSSIGDELDFGIAFICGESPICGAAWLGARSFTGAHHPSRHAKRAVCADAHLFGLREHRARRRLCELYRSGSVRARTGSWGEQRQRRNVEWRGSSPGCATDSRAGVDKATLWIWANASHLGGQCPLMGMGPIDAFGGAPYGPPPTRPRLRSWRFRIPIPDRFHAAFRSCCAASGHAGA
jgi:hypothetical protein